MYIQNRNDRRKRTCICVICPQVVREDWRWKNCYSIKWRTCYGVTCACLAKSWTVYYALRIKSTLTLKYKLIVQKNPQTLSLYIISVESNSRENQTCNNVGDKKTKVNDLFLVLLFWFSHLSSKLCRKLSEISNFMIEEKKWSNTKKEEKLMRSEMKREYRWPFKVGMKQINERYALVGPSINNDVFHDHEYGKYWWVFCFVLFIWHS